jgi:hypothetical protein
MWITLGKKHKVYSLLYFNSRNRILSLWSVLKAKPFPDLYFVQGWCKASHMPTPQTSITHQHNGNPYRLPTQHTMKFNRNEAKDESIWPFTLGRWHGAQLCRWSFPVWPFQLSNNNTLKIIIICTYKITCLIVTSKIVSQCCLLQVHIISQLKVWT